MRTNTIIQLCLFALTIAACAPLSPKMPEVTLGRISPDEQKQADAYYHFMNGSLREQEGDLDRAMAEYETAFKLDPGSADVAGALASLSLHRGRTEDAQRYAQKA